MAGTDLYRNWVTSLYTSKDAMNPSRASGPRVPDQKAQSSEAMDLTLKQLCAFVAVAEAEQFTRAAERLDLSQSAVSTLIKQLERNLGVRLFDRHTRLLRLTAAGTESLPIIKRAIADIESVVEGTKELKLLRRGRLAIAAGTMQAALSMPKLIREFCDAHPMVSVTLHDVPERSVTELVRNGTVELGVGTIPDGEVDLVGLRLVGDTFLVVMPTNHPLATKRELLWRDLADLPLIGPHPENPIRRRLEIELARQGITLRRLYDVMLPLTMIGMVEAGLGIAVMTTAVGRLAEAMGLVARAPVKPTIEREISLISRRDRSLSPAARQFREFVYRLRRSRPVGPQDAALNKAGRSSRTALPSNRATQKTLRHPS
jgi:DNA-binding transcriptional LysR family regulator